jgi:hypothetical protein
MSTTKMETTSISGVIIPESRLAREATELVVMRRGCNNRLRNAVYHWSRVATMSDDRSRAHYAKLRAQGHSHGRALRTLADRWLTVLVAMLTTQERFDSARWNACVIAPQATL